MKRKIFKSLFLVILLSTFTFLPQKGIAQLKPGEPYRFGATMITSGSDAEYVNKYQTQGILDAVKEINDHGGVKGHPIKLILEDTKADPSTGAMVTKKLITLDKVHAIVTLMSNVTLAQLPVVEQNKVILFGAWVKAPGLAEKSRWVARVCDGGYETGQEMGKVALKRGIKSVAIIHEQVEGVLSQTKGFEEVFEKGGGKILGKESFRKGDPEFRAQITKLMGKGAEGFYILSTMVRDKAVIFKQMAELGWKPKHLLSMVAIETKEFLEIAGKTAEGVFYVTNYQDPEFVNSWEKRYGYTPDAPTGAYYDSVKLLALAFGQVKDDAPPEAVRDVLYNIKNYKGAQGITSFNGNGQGIVQYMVRELRGGKFVEVKD